MIHTVNRVKAFYDAKAGKVECGLVVKKPESHTFLTLIDGVKIGVKVLFVSYVYPG